jgi:hypothetical protein
MRLNTLSPAPGRVHAKKRVGRGMVAAWVKLQVVDTKV